MVQFPYKGSKRAPKKVTVIQPMTPQAAHAAAYALLQRGLTDKTRFILELVYSAGIVMAYRLPLSTRTLVDYHNKRLIDRLAYTSKEVRDALNDESIGIPLTPKMRTLLYVLGPVGVEIIEIQRGKEIPSPARYLALALNRLLHDIIVSEIAFTLITHAVGWEIAWVPRNEAAIYSSDSKLVLEPDALLYFRRGDQEISVAIEYHHQDDSRGGFEKVRNYLNLYAQPNLWGQWGDRFPILLGVFRGKNAGRGYEDAVNSLSIPDGLKIYGRTLKSFWTDPTHWYSFVERTKVSLFGDGQQNGEQADAQQDIIASTN